MESLSQVVTIVASLAAIAAPPAALAIGLVPRLGPMRAIVLALSTRFRRAQDVSQRTNELHMLRSMLSSSQKAQYVIVSGPKGVGKTCLVDTTLQYTFGVVSVRVAAGANTKEILADTYRAITRSNISFLDYSGGALRVLWWHYFFFRQPVTVVLQATERSSAEPFAALHGAARALTHDFGVRVLIDASNNSLPVETTATKREKILELEPMQRALLEQIPELKPLHDALKKANLADVVWIWVGGNPADYKSLWGSWQDHQGTVIDQPMAFERVVAVFVRNLRSQALENVNIALASNKHLRGLFDKFRESSEVPSTTLKEMELVRPPPDKVLRLVRRTFIDSQGKMEVGRFLVPADAATAAVLREVY
jgi:hypothetical protein